MDRRLVPVLASSVAVLLTATLGGAAPGSPRWVDRRPAASHHRAAWVRRQDAPHRPSHVRLHSRRGASRLEDARDRPTLRSSAAYWLLIGVGVIAKGPPILMFVGGFGLALLLAGWRRWIISGRFWITFPISVVVGCRGTCSCARQATDKLVNQYYIYEIVTRVTGHFRGSNGPPGYYLAPSLVGLMPWLPFVPGALIAAWKDRSDPAHQAAGVVARDSVAGPRTDSAPRGRSM